VGGKKRGDRCVRGAKKGYSGKKKGDSAKHKLAKRAALVGSGEGRRGKTGWEGFGPPLIGKKRVHF